jgi:hypothetical protein
MIFPSEIRGKELTERSKPEGVKPKMRERKLRSDVNWQGSLKQKGLKQGLDIYIYIYIHTHI